MRRQASAAGNAREGSGSLFELDPLRLPASFTQTDPAADGGSREVEISREGISYHRAVRGVQMRVKLVFAEFEGVAVRVIGVGEGEPVIFLSLEHRDDELSILLKASGDSDASAAAARKWSRITGRPILVAGPDGRLRNPASVAGQAKKNIRRKRRSALRNRRSTIRLRSQRAAQPIDASVYTGECEIIARG